MKDDLTKAQASRLRRLMGTAGPEDIPPERPEERLTPEQAARMERLGNAPEPVEMRTIFCDGQIIRVPADEILPNERPVRSSNPGPKRRPLYEPQK
jgi:hypothetical protein